MPNLLAMLAAVKGDMSPVLLLPSVNNITTLLLALLSLRRPTALANPIPIAVPSSINPLAAMSVLTFCKRFINDAWSVVIGHCVKASPAKIVRPILSSGRPEMNSEATLLAASIRLGLRSSANILVETSIANMMSMPSTVRCPQLLWVCGLANATTIKTNAMRRNNIGIPIRRTRRLLGAY